MEPDEAGEKPNEEPDNDITQQIPLVQEALVFQQTSQGPALSREIIHSMTYYALVMAVGPLAAWAGWATSRHPVLWWIAVIFTVMGLLVCLLRFVRGSVLDSEERALNERALYTPPLKVTDRVSKRLEPGEILLWETRLHPLSLVWTWGKQLFGNVVGLLLLAAYVGAVIAVFKLGSHPSVHLPEWAFAVTPLPAIAYLGYTVAFWRSEWYVVTEKRFFAVRGVFFTSTPWMKRAMISDFRAFTPAISHFLTWCRFTDRPFGTWKVETPGQWQGLKSVYFMPDADLNSATHAPMRP